MISKTRDESQPSRSLQFWSLVLPVLKCAVCPACLSLLGGVFAGARLGWLGDERLHGGILTFALIADYFILRAATRHHRSRWPLGLCLLGGAIAILGHFVSETVEFIGFGLLMFAAVLNVVLLGRRRQEGGDCCVHDSLTDVGCPIHRHG